MPGVVTEPDTVPPAHLAPYWESDFCTFHSPAWWRRHWEKTGRVTVEVADSVPHGWEDWLHWSHVCARAGRGFERDTVMLEADEGRLLGFTRVVAARR